MPDSKGADAKTESSSSVSDGGVFPLETSDGRKYVRLELSSPVQFHVLTCAGGKLRLSKRKRTAEILNLSEGGMLLVTESVVPAEGFMVVTLDLNRLLVLEGVLGKIKRVEPSGEGDFLVGLQFVAEEELEKQVPSEEIRRLPVKITSFKHEIREIISDYMRTTELATK